VDVFQKRVQLAYMPKAKKSVPGDTHLLVVPARPATEVPGAVALVAQTPTRKRASAGPVAQSRPQVRKVATRLDGARASARPAERARQPRSAVAGKSPKKSA
jgi:hypothetical protein